MMFMFRPIQEDSGSNSKHAVDSNDCVIPFPGDARRTSRLNVIPTALSVQEGNSPRPNGDFWPARPEEWLRGIVYRAEQQTRGLPGGIDVPQRTQISIPLPGQMGSGILSNSVDAWRTAGIQVSEGIASTVDESVDIGAQANPSGIYPIVPINTQYAHGTCFTGSGFDTYWHQRNRSPISLQFHRLGKEQVLQRPSFASPASLPLHVRKSVHVARIPFFPISADRRVDRYAARETGIGDENITTLICEAAAARTKSGMALTEATATDVMKCFTSAATPSTVSAVSAMARECAKRRALKNAPGKVHISASAVEGSSNARHKETKKHANIGAPFAIASSASRSAYAPVVRQSCDSSIVDGIASSNPSRNSRGIRAMRRERSVEMPSILGQKPKLVSEPVDSDAWFTSFEPLARDVDGAVLSRSRLNILQGNFSGSNDNDDHSQDGTVPSFNSSREGRREAGVESIGREVEGEMLPSQARVRGTLSSPKPYGTGETISSGTEGSAGVRHSATKALMNKPETHRTVETATIRVCTQLAQHEIAAADSRIHRGSRNVEQHVILEGKGKRPIPNNGKFSGSGISPAAEENLTEKDVVFQVKADDAISNRDATQGKRLGVKRRRPRGASPGPLSRGSGPALDTFAPPSPFNSFGHISSLNGTESSRGDISGPSEYSSDQALGQNVSRKSRSLPHWAKHPPPLPGIDWASQPALCEDNTEVYDKSKDERLPANREEFSERNRTKPWEPAAWSQSSVLDGSWWRCCSATYKQEECKEEAEFEAGGPGPMRTEDSPSGRRKVDRDKGSKAFEENCCSPRGSSRWSSRCRAPVRKSTQGSPRRCCTQHHDGGTHRIRNENENEVLLQHLAEQAMGTKGACRTKKRRVSVTP